MVMANSFLGVLDESKSSGREKNPYAFPTSPPASRPKRRWIIRLIFLSGTTAITLWNVSCQFYGVRVGGVGLGVEREGGLTDLEHMAIIELYDYER